MVYHYSSGSLLQVVGGSSRPGFSWDLLEVGRAVGSECLPRLVECLNDILHRQKTHQIRGGPVLEGKAPWRVDGGIVVEVHVSFAFALIILRASVSSFLLLSSHLEGASNAIFVGGSTSMWSSDKALPGT